jgi:hypothetical protein
MGLHKGTTPKNFKQFLSKAHTPEVWKKIGLTNSISQKGKHHSEETKRKMSLAKKDKMPKNINLLIQKAVKFKKGEIVKGAILFTKENHSGEKNNLWKGGITPLNIQLRMSSLYKIWREVVFLRDNFTCKNPDCPYCHNLQGVLLNAHHIKSFAKFPELRFEISNGITYCKGFHLHSKLHKNSEEEIELENE